MAPVHHRTAKVGPHPVFYREAGPSDAPTVLLLHGYPASSHQFRALIPRLADRYHVVAPDYIGFGYSDAPSPDAFPYTFDALTDVVLGLVDTLGLDRFAVYVHDYGAPVCWRIALRRPEAITAVITQNGNGYEEGLADSFWGPVRAYWDDPSAENEAAAREAQSLEKIRWQYLHGLDDPSLVSPDTWHHDHALISRPGMDVAQLSLLRDYRTNLDVYPRLHDWLRTSHVPLLAVWGGRDEIFPPEGARAFARDLPDAEIHLLDGGHFLLESHLDEALPLIRDFLKRTQPGS
ncbi:alpha/beta fold hydrolase [Streptomyces sp. SBT349]|uniref:alpha/beta fold hydrolase n=1 Tax=Streptomyces sp. SBT349 TaxID=1580539 RepID=UPI00066A4025|nr:alpha/beta hydrolase [Streptomyces sp. SBT349]